MGRKTFESLRKPLKDRLHVVVTKQKTYKVPKGVEVFHDIQSALKFCETQTQYWGDEVFVIGGGEIYKQTLNRADKLYLTLIHKEFDGDTEYPDYEQDFIMTHRKDCFGDVPYSFCLFVLDGKTVRGKIGILFSFLYLDRRLLCRKIMEFYRNR